MKLLISNKRGERFDMKQMNCDEYALPLDLSNYWHFHLVSLFLYWLNVTVMTFSRVQVCTQIIMNYNTIEYRIDPDWETRSLDSKVVFQDYIQIYKFYRKRNIRVNILFKSWLFIREEDLIFPSFYFILIILKRMNLPERF